MFEYRIRGNFYALSMPTPPVTSAALPPPTLHVEPLPASPIALAPQPQPPPVAVLRAFEPELQASQWLGLVRDAITYPMRKDGWYILLPGALLAIALLIATAFGMHLSIIPFVFGCGYFSAYYLSIIETSVSGRDEPPEWPSVSSIMDDIIMPAVAVVIAALVSFVPLNLYEALDLEGGVHLTMETALFLAGILYFPFALLSYSVRGGLGSLLPHYVLRDMFRCGKGTGVVLGLELVLGVFLFVFLACFLWIPWVGLFIGVLAVFYTMLAHGRLMALFYRRYEHKLEC